MTTLQGTLAAGLSRLSPPSQHTGIITAHRNQFIAAHRNHLICPSLLQSTEHRLSHALGTSPGAPGLRDWIPAGSFALFGSGDAAVQLLAVGAEGPLLGLAARVGAVPVTKALGLPLPCRGKRQRREVMEEIMDIVKNACIL